MKEVLAKLLRGFVEDWLIAAELDGVPLEEIDVNLVCVLNDICEMAGIDAREIGLAEKELV